MLNKMNLNLKLNLEKSRYTIGNSSGGGSTILPGTWESINDSAVTKVDDKDELIQKLKAEIKSLKSLSWFSKYHVAKKSLDDAAYIAKDILQSLPKNRDWLNPDTESMLKGLACSTVACQIRSK